MTTRLELIRNLQLGVKIPKGWRELKIGEKLKIGDKWHVYNGGQDQWYRVNEEDNRVGSEYNPECFSLHITTLKENKEKRTEKPPQHCCDWTGPETCPGCRYEKNKSKY